MSHKYPVLHKTLRTRSWVMLIRRCVVAAIIAATISACTDEQPETDGLVRDRSGEIEAGTPTFGIYNTLKVMKAQVEVGDEVKRDFFDSEGRAFIVNGESVEVHEFDSKDDVDEAVAKIASDGSIAGAPAWKSPVHFFRTDRVIVLYLGNNPQTLQALETSTGEQFAGN